MKMKDVKPVDPKKNRTVGDLIEFLSQFPKDTRLVMCAESDACREGGYPFFYAHAMWADSDDWFDARIHEGVAEGDMEVKSVVITVDH